ncbi:MAG: helix-turn-helix domain-containing protein, partial [Actinobacteria bacterium]|nr:helix-turn-helix domain-containing protein [Actinomycetota bacterium]
MLTGPDHDEEAGIGGDPFVADGSEGTEIGPGCAAFLRLGANVRDLRNAAGLTLDSLAEAASGPDRRLEHSWVWQLEAGRSQTGVLQAMRLAGALGAALDGLVDGIFWNPGEIARRPGERRPDDERLGGFLTVLPPGEPAFEAPEEPSFVGGREDVAAVIARNVGDARTRRHLRQRDLGLADSAGAGLIESGRRQPELQGILTMAQALEVPPEFLLRGMRWQPSEGSPTQPRRRGRRHDFHANDDAVTTLWRDDLTVAEIAARLEITQPSVEGIVRRLRARGVYLPSRARGRRAAQTVPEEEEEGQGTAPSEDLGALRALIASNLKRHRLAAGLSLEQLAEAVESSITMVWRAENRGAELRLTTVLRLAGALGVSVATITRGIAYGPRTGALSLDAGGDPDREPDIGPRLGENIRRRRRELRLSQEDVAARTGIYRRHFSAIESGDALPRPITLLVLAEGLETDLRELFAGTYDWYVRPLPPPEYVEGEGPPSKAERQERLLRMWAEGRSTRAIADALDLTPSAVGGLINEMRAVGIDVPYRHPPTSPAQLGTRLRRRRRSRRRPGAPRSGVMAATHQVPASEEPEFEGTRSRSADFDWPAGEKLGRVGPAEG